MTDHQKDGPALIAETVGRLRCVQIDFADEPAEVRQQHLREELDRAMARLVPASRPGFLEEVLRRFPNWECSENGTSAPPAASASESAEALMSDPESLVQRLIDAAADLPEDRRQALRDRLTAAGLSSQGAAWPSDMAAKLKLPPNATVVPERVLDVLAQLLASADQVDDVAWQTWRQLDRQNTRRKPSDIRSSVVSYLIDASGESPRRRAAPAPTKDELAERIRLFQRLAGSLIYELREIDIIARQQAERFSPEKIERVSEQGMLETVGAACWRTFKKIAADYDAEAIEREIKQRIAQHVEENLR